MRQIGAPVIIEPGQVGGEVGEDGVVEQVTVVVGVLLVENPGAGDAVLVDLFLETDTVRTEDGLVVQVGEG